jgi:protein tyrosine/serine phosphatase
MRTRRVLWWPSSLDVPPPSHRRGRLWRAALTGVVFGLVLAVLAQVGHILLGGNFHEVVRGRVYRSAQLSPEALEQRIRDRGIRTVINLRGDNVGEDWYHREIEATERNGADFRDVGLWAYHPPLRTELIRLVELLEHAEAPVLVHCQSGADRAGLASALALLLLTDSTVADARGQLALHYGHNSWGQAGCHDRLLDRYEEWLQSEGQTHTPAQLRHWVRQVYDRTKIVR